MNIKLVHILNDVNGEREKKSIESLSKLKDIGINYIQQITPLNDTPPPIESIYYKSTNKRVYGLYLSYTKAIKENFTDDLDALIICECDSVLSIPINQVYDELKKTLSFCKKYDIYHFSWGGMYVDGVQQGEILKTDPEYNNYCVVSSIILAHFNIFLPISNHFYKYLIDLNQWAALDVWLNLAFHKHLKESGHQATVKKSLAYQIDGISYLENKYKSKTS